MTVVDGSLTAPNHHSSLDLQEGGETTLVMEKTAEEVVGISWNVDQHLQEEEDAEVEEEDSLKHRPPKSSVLENGGKNVSAEESQILPNQEQPQEKETSQVTNNINGEGGIAEPDLQAQPEIAEEEVLTGGLVQSHSNNNNNNSIYLDKDNGTWKCRHCSWTYCIGNPGIDHNPDHKGHYHWLTNFKMLTEERICFPLDLKEFRNGPEKNLGTKEFSIPLNGADIQKSPTTANNHQIHRDLKDEGTTGLHLLLSEKSSDNRIADSKHVERPVKVVEEGKQEVAEWDVERVLKEQDTHDLYCPNCNSCITKRVILSKRKRTVGNLQFAKKREKVDVISSPAVATPPTNDQDRPTVEVTGGQDPDTGPDVFTCLSCFTFFIRTVSGFKLFRCFRDGDEGESSEPLLSRDRVEPGDEVIHLEEEYVVKETNSLRDLPKQQSNNISSVTSLLGKIRSSPANDLTKEPHKDRENIIFTSTDGSLLVEEYAVKEVISSEYLAKHQNDSNLSVISRLNTSHTLPAKVSTMKPQNDKEYSIVSTLPASLLVEEVKTDVGENPDDRSHALPDSPMEHHKDREYSIVSTIPAFLLVEEVKKDVGENVDDAIKITNEGNQPSLPYQESNHPKKPLSDNALVTNGEPGEQLLLKPQEDKGDVQQFTDLQSLTTGDDEKLDNVIDRLIAEHKLPTTTPILIDSRAKEPVKLLPEQQSTPLAETHIEIEGQPGEAIGGPDVRPDVIVPVEPDRPLTEDRTVREWDILKSIVYGGLIESITSLSVVSSAAGGDATTLNIVALGLANLVGGLFIMAHGLKDLRNKQYGAVDENGNTDRYQEVLGQRRNFRLHAVVAVVSYLVFGLVPPVTYGFSFYKSNNKEYKLIAVAAASLFAIIVLAIAKAYTRKPPKSYISTVTYYISIGVMASGLSFVVGVLIQKLLEKLGLFESSRVGTIPPSVILEKLSTKPGWASF